MELKRTHAWLFAMWCLRDEKKTKFETGGNWNESEIWFNFFSVNLVCWRQQNWAGLFSSFTAYPAHPPSLALCESCCDHSCSCRIYRIWFDVFSSNASQENKNELNLSSFLKQVAALFFISILFAFILTSHSITASLRVKKREKEWKKNNGTKVKIKAIHRLLAPLYQHSTMRNAIQNQKFSACHGSKFRSVWYVWPFTTRQQKSLNK